MTSRRTKRFVAIAKDEVSCDGYQKYAPISKGPWINGLIILLIIPVVPFYLAWRFLLSLLNRVNTDS